MKNILKFFGLAIITIERKRQNKKAVEQLKRIKNEIDQMLIHKDFDLKKGNINDHRPPNAKKLDPLEYAKASNFYSVLYRQKVEYLNSIVT